MKHILVLTFCSLIFVAPAFAEKKISPSNRQPNQASQVFSKSEVSTQSQLNKFNSGFADVIEEVSSSVVNISALQDVPAASLNAIDQILNDRNNKKLSSLGAGFILSKEGLIVTNHHVIDDSVKILVTLDDDTKHVARLVGIDKKTDLALIKITTNKELKPASFGDSDKVRVGDWAIVSGNPYGLGKSFSIGIISAKGRDLNNGQIEEFIQTDAAINNGNSGGPMFNLKGEIIGISTAIFSPSGGSVGIGFATPSSTAIQVIRQLKERGEVTRGWLGVSVQDVSAEIAEVMKIEKTRGAFVTDVFPNEPAAKAGILPADIIVKFDDQDVPDMKTLPKIVSTFPIGKSAKVTVLRSGKNKVFNVIITKMKDGEIKKPEVKTSERRRVLKQPTYVLGLALSELRESVKRGQSASEVSGLMVAEVSMKSEAAEKNIMQGDIIISANQSPVDSIDEFKSLIEDAKKSSSKLFLFIKRGDTNYPVVLSNLR